MNYIQCAKDLVNGKLKTHRALTIIEKEQNPVVL